MKTLGYYDYNEETGDISFNSDRYARKVKGKIAGWVKTDEKRQTSYRELRFNGRTVKAHRLAWRIFYNEWPSGIIDHINGNGLDNRICNLRVVSSVDSARNKPRQRNNTSGVNGVNFYKPTGKWVAKISLNGFRKTIGYYSTLEEAAKAREKYEAKEGYDKNHGR